MKIKNKTAIKVRLAQIAKKSIPSEGFQPKDIPAELTAREGNGMDFILSLKLQANSKSALVKPAKQQTETKTKQSSENWEGKAGRLEQLRSLSHGWGGKALSGAAEQSQPQQQCCAHFTYLPVPGICLGNSEGAQLIKKVF